MKKQYILYSLKLLLVRLAFILISVFFLIAFVWLLKIKHGFVYYSVATTLFLYSFIFNDSYKNAERELRAGIKSHPLKIIAIASFSEIPTVIILFTVLLSSNTNLPNIIYVLWNAPFAGFLIPHGDVISSMTINFAYYIMPFIIPLMAGIGYSYGLKHSNITGKYIDKLMYKKKDTNEKND